jgi:hypothetical protein
MSNKVKTLNTMSLDCGVRRNIRLASKIEQRFDGLKVTLPQEPLIVGAVDAQAAPEAA